MPEHTLEHTPDYTSDSAFETSLEALVTRLRPLSNVLITTHVRPDGDALGTVKTMSIVLSHLGIKHDILLLSKMPTKHQFLFQDMSVSVMQVLEKMPITTADMSRYDGLLVVDTGTWSQLPGLKDLIEGSGERWTGTRLVLDHHLTQEDWADVKLVRTSAAAAGEIAAAVAKHVGVPMTHRLAEAIYVALVSDTGWFQFSNTTPATMRLAAELMETGVDTDAMYQRLYQNERPQRLLMQQCAMQSMQLLADNRLGVMTLTRADFSSTKSGVPDTDGLVNLPLQIGTVAVSALFVEPPEGGAVRVSLRSKGQVSVATFAEQFGGGGHARAAGLKIEGTMDEVRTRVVDALLKTLQETT